MSDTPAVRLRDVTVVYNEGTANEVVALRGITLTVFKGETLIITGWNGSGKSTLLKAIAGTAPVRSGAIYIGEREVTHWPPYKRARMLGFIFQDPMLGTCPNLTVHENLRLVASKRWWSPFPEQLILPRDQSEIIKASGLALDDKAATTMNSLSGGQRQGAALLLALTSRRSLLLMDEFTSSLDDHVRASYLSLIAAESLRRKLTILCVMHDPDGLGMLRSRSIRLVDGSVEDQYSASTHAQAGDSK